MTVSGHAAARCTHPSEPIDRGGLLMNDLKKQVRLAQRRLVAQQFLSVVPWTLFGTLLLAAVGHLAQEADCPLNVPSQAWTFGWLAGSVVGGLALAGIMTYSAPLRCAERGHRDRSSLRFKRTCFQLPVADVGRVGVGSRAGVDARRDASRRQRGCGQSVSRPGQSLGPACRQVLPPWPSA